MDRVLLVIPTLDRSGAEKQLTLLARGLAATGEFDVHVACLTRGGPLEAPLAEAGIPCTVIGKRWKLDPFAWLRLRALIRRLAPRLVHTWLFAANSYGRTAALAAGKAVIVAGERCVDPWKRWHELAIDRWLARRTARIVTNSTGVQAFYAERGIPGEKFAIIPNAVEPAPAMTGTRAELLDELELPADARLVGVVGRLWPQKRVKDLIWTADLVKCVRDDVHVLIVGDGPQRWRLERFARQTQILDKVHFLGHRGDVPRIMAHLDLLWLGSEYEGQPNVVLEAMAAGVPVIGTEIPGVTDLIVPGETGELFPVGERNRLLALTRMLLDDDERRRGYGEAARRRAAERFSPAAMVAGHVALYRELLQQG